MRRGDVDGGRDGDIGTSEILRGSTAETSPSSRVGVSARSDALGLGGAEAALVTVVEKSRRAKMTKLLRQIDADRGR